MSVSQLREAIIIFGQDPVGQSHEQLTKQFIAAKAQYQQPTYVKPYKINVINSKIIEDSFYHSKAKSQVLYHSILQPLQISTILPFTDSKSCQLQAKNRINEQVSYKNSRQPLIIQKRQIVPQTIDEIDDSLSKISLSLEENKDDDVVQVLKQFCATDDNSTNLKEISNQINNNNVLVQQQLDNINNMGHQVESSNVLETFVVHPQRKRGMIVESTIFLTVCVAVGLILFIQSQ